MITKKGTKRGGYYSSRPNSNSPNYFPAAMYDITSVQIPSPGHPPVFDSTVSQDSFDGTNYSTDAVFEKEILDRAALLTPSTISRAKVGELTSKVIRALEEIKNEKSVSDGDIQQIFRVGSYVTDTALSSNNESDVVVQLNTLPSFETVSALGDKITQIITSANPKDCPSAVAHDYGCCIMTPGAQVRVLVTILPENVSKLEPELHLSEKIMMVNFFAVRHAKWYHLLVEANDQQFIQEFKSLVRVLKDVRRRFPLLLPLSPWVIQYIAYFCLLNGPNREKTNLGTAFRRFFEQLAAGIVMPKSNSIVDPTTITHKIGWDLNYQQMDDICRTAQTLVQVFATGNDGYRAVLGTNSEFNLDNLNQVNTINGVTIEPNIEAYREGCMDPYLPN